MAAVDRSLVAQLPVFAGLAPAELDTILSEARSIRYPKNSAVFEQGEEAHSFFVLLHGHVRASKTTPAGQQVVVRYVSPGEIFGVAPAIGLTNYPATATAVDDSVALAWPSAAWPRLVARFPRLPPTRCRPSAAGCRRPIPAWSRCRRSRWSGASPTPCCGSPSRPAGRSTRRGDRFPDQPAGHRRDDRHHAAYREPHVERLGERAWSRAAASASCCATAPAVRAGRGPAPAKPSR